MENYEKMSGGSRRRDVYRSMVLAFRMSELQVGGGNRNVNNLQFCRILISILAARLESGEK